MTPLYQFLTELAANNNREWFHANKPRYDVLRAQWLDQLAALIALMAEWEPSLASVSAKQAAHRIYRDTRFSSDKTPYKTYFSATIATPRDRRRHLGYYIELGPGRNVDGQCAAGLYGGIWCPDNHELAKLRHAIVDNIEEWDEIVTEPEVCHYFPGFIGEALKTIPKGWERNHPQAQWLRYKEFGRMCRCTPSYFATDSWIAESARRFRLLQPMIRFLSYSLDE